MSESRNDPPDLPPLIRITRQLALIRMQSHSRKSHIVLSEPQIELAIRAHWMALVMLSGADVHMIFKIYFMIKETGAFTENTFGSEKYEVGQTHDFFKEFCNLVAGGLKNYLSQNSVTVGSSLPLVTRGFNDLFFPRSQGDEHLFDHFQLQIGEQSVQCGVHFELSKDMKKLDAPLVEFDDGVEFF